MFVAGFIGATILIAPLFFILGRFERADRRTTHEPADLSRVLRRP